MKIENKYIYLIVGIVIGGVCVWFLTSNVNSQSNFRMMRASNNSIQNRNVIDAHFIEQMIPHHEDAITMSKIALEKATRPEVKELAADIISSQSKEIDQMNNWYKEWFNRDLPTGSEVMQVHGMMGGNGMHMGEMGTDEDIENLENSQDFDKEYIEEMIPHHQTAVMMASMLKFGTERPEMKKLADDIITAQTKEIDMMRKWLQEWK